MATDMEKLVGVSSFYGGLMGCALVACRSMMAAAYSPVGETDGGLFAHAVQCCAYLCLAVRAWQHVLTPNPHPGGVQLNRK